MINKELLEKVGINYKKGLAFFGYDEAMYQKYLLDFANETYTKDAIQNLTDKDIKGAFYNVHSMKSLVEYISIPSIDEIVHEITETLREGKIEGVVDGLRFINIATESMKEAILTDMK